MVTRHTLVSIVLGLVLVASARAELLLTPRAGYYELDGIKFPQLIFSDGGAKEVTYSPPTGWEYSGNASKLTLRPRNKPDVEATVTRTKLAEPVMFDDTTVKKLADEALATIPQGSVDIIVRSQEANPLVINGKETFLVTVSYTAFGRKFGRSLMFLNRDKEQIRFQLVSPWADFQEMQRAFFASHFTWQNL